ncbi:MAG: ankyrin repeat domain-containing protein [Candidatus Methylacidiphilaceae bacterium]
MKRKRLAREIGWARVPRWTWGIVAGFWLVGCPSTPGASVLGETRSFPEGGRWVFLHRSPDIVGFQDPALAKSQDEGESDIACLLILSTAPDGLGSRDRLDRLLRDAYLSYYNEMVGSRAPYFRRQKLSFFVIRPGALPDGQGHFAGSEVAAAGTVGLGEMAAGVFPQEISARQIRIAWGRGEGEAAGFADAAAEGVSREQQGGRRKTLSALREAIGAHSQPRLEKILASEPHYPIDYGAPDSALVEAVRRDPRLAALLVDRYGADPVPQAAVLVRALSSSMDQEAIIAMLGSFFKHGLRINAADDAGQTILHRCVALGYGTAAAFLLEQGANPNVQDRTDMTPLMIAVERRDVGMARLLLEHGADAHLAKNGMGETATDMARRLHEPILTKLLEENP